MNFHNLEKKDTVVKDEKSRSGLQTSVHGRKRAKKVKFWQTVSFSNLRRSCTPAASSSRPEPDGLRNRNDEDLGRAPAYPLQIELRRLLLSPELAPLTGKGDTESLENKEVNLATKKIEAKMCVFF